MNALTVLFPYLMVISKSSKNWELSITTSIAATSMHSILKIAEDFTTAVIGKELLMITIANISGLRASPD
jgi:hypothetical protein